MQSIHALIIIECTALLVAFPGCVSYVDRPHGEAVYVEPAPVVIVEPDDFVYYPRYQMYYGSRSHHYYYRDGRSWVTRPAPRDVSVGVLFSSPSVSVDFHDGPAPHHATIVRQYPKHWTPPGSSPNRRGGNRDKRERNDREGWR